jgi:signal transduction histidine kinase
VFEPFVQLAEPGSKPTDGLGLGLPLARELLQMQGGFIAVRNVEGGLEVLIEFRSRLRRRV